MIDKGRGEELARAGVASASDLEGAVGVRP